MGWLRARTSSKRGELQGSSLCAQREAGLVATCSSIRADPRLRPGRTETEAEALLEAAVREVPFRVDDREASVLFYKGPGPRIFIMNAAFVFPEQSDHWYTALVEQDLPRVAACLYTGISDLPFLRRAGAQLHAAGGTHFMLLARDALADLFPIRRYWLAHLAVIVLHAAWHGIGAWRQGMYYLAADPEA